MDTVIKADNLGKIFGKTVALHAVSFEMKENIITGLIGRNGAGKTTLLKICAGFLKPTTGKISVFGENPFDNLNAAEKIMYIDEATSYGELNNLDEIIKLAKIHYPKWDDKMEGIMMELFELEYNKKYTKLSKGMKTRFKIMVGICSNADITLLDEPAAGMDSFIRKEMYRQIIDNYMKRPRTIILSSHLLNETEKILEDIILVDKGNFILHQPAERLRQHAVYLSGAKEILEKYVYGKEVLNVREFGNRFTVAVRKHMIKDDEKWLKENNIEISKVEIDDLCIYLSRAYRRGGEYFERRAVS